MRWEAFYGSLVTASTTLLTVLAATAVLLPRGRRELQARLALASSLSGLAVAALVSLAQLAPTTQYRSTFATVVAGLGILMVLVEVGVGFWTRYRSAPTGRALSRSQRWWLLADVPTTAAYVAIMVWAGEPAAVAAPVSYLLIAGTVESLLTAPVESR